MENAVYALLGFIGFSCLMILLGLWLTWLDGGDDDAP